MSGGSDDAARILAGLFNFEVRGRNRFRAAPTFSPMARLYGGQVVAQALTAAQRTVAPARQVHSCHAYFVGPGDPAHPIDLAVARDTDGRSFSARRVTARQGRRLILTLAASFHDNEPAAAAQTAMPAVPSPDALPSQTDLIAAVADRLPARLHAFWLEPQAVDYRMVEPFAVFAAPPAPPQRHIWMRIRTPLGDDPCEHRRLLAYASDLHIMHSGLKRIGIGWADANLQTASLDHTIWFHGDFRADEWVLYALDSDFAGNSRTLGRGLVFTADGRLIASIAQEGLARVRG